ncbi:MAG: Na+/H+ antiporter subunit D, partial [Bacteroidetes bacterium]|nr:Na+/H+ antiporter subunit D [Bacteroidota bacterium]
MIILAPVLLPLFYIVLSLVTRSKSLKQALAVVFSFLNLAAAVTLLWLVDHNEMLVSHVGSWPAPYGIVMVA